MNSTPSKQVKLLTKIIQQYATAHGNQPPKKVVVEPLALVALGLKQSVAPTWAGVPVECRDFGVDEVVERADGNSIGVYLDTATSHVVACSLYTI